MLIGRSSELQSIVSEIAKPATANDVKRIIAVHGMFGVGKSTVLREVVERLHNASHVDVVLSSNEDARLEHLPEFVHQLLNSFYACRDDIPRYKSDETDSRWMRYIELRKEMDSLFGPAAPNHDNTTELAEARQNYTKQRNADERRLLSDTASVMCEALIVDLMNTFFPLQSRDGEDPHFEVPSTQRKIVVVIDTYEKMSTALNAWLLEHFLLYCYIKRFGDFRSYNSPYLSPEVHVRQFFDIRFLLAGREPLFETDPERRWDRWQSTVLDIPLKQFNPQHVREYFELENNHLIDVQEVMRSTGGIPYLVSLWSRTQTIQGSDPERQSIVSHAADRILWYKSTEQKAWVRCAAFCEWFDADLLRCFSEAHANPHKAYEYLRRRSELCRTSQNQPDKLELIPVVRESLRATVQKESPEEARGYEEIVRVALQARETLANFSAEEQRALKHLAHVRHFQAEKTVAALWPHDQDIVERLIERVPTLFERHTQSRSLKTDLRELLAQFCAQYDRSEDAEEYRRIADYWAKRKDELSTDVANSTLTRDQLQATLLTVERELEQAQLDVRDAQSHAMELEQEIHPLRQSTPPYTSNRDAAAARIALILCVMIVAATWYAPELSAYFHAVPDMVDAVQKVLLAFAIGFGVLFVFFLSRSVALRQQRRQHHKNRQLLADLDERYGVTREKLNASFALVESKKRERATLVSRLEEIDRHLQRRREELEQAVL